MSLDIWLKNYGDCISIFTKISFVLQICYGINFLHENKIVHRDIKATNILVEKNLRTKLIDFG